MDASSADASSADTQWKNMNHLFESLKLPSASLKFRFESAKFRFEGLAFRFESLKFRFESLKFRFEGLKFRFERGVVLNGLLLIVCASGH